MAAPVDTSAYPQVYDVYIAPFDPADPDTAVPLPQNAVDEPPAAMTHVGQVDGSTITTGLMQGKNPHVIAWLAGSPAASFAYSTDYSVIYQGVDPAGGTLRACLSDVVYTQSQSTGTIRGNATPDDSGVRAYWYYKRPQPPAA